MAESDEESAAGDSDYVPGSGSPSDDSDASSCFSGDSDEEQVPSQLLTVVCCTANFTFFLCYPC